MGGACSTHMGKCEIYIHDLDRKDPEGRGHSADLDVDGKIILE